ncbi:RICIN domain-containing protein [Streptomyces sp. NBC_01477]|uniref:RICIN domain-containing protein n=1 Tax=Streptomyces sp. NBC_01477 TaxID=2976015 RepID=UPI002E314434|nr:RICIN domain-containing protein [Streptomyces sp. NBC_01477]
MRAFRRPLLGPLMAAVCAAPLAFSMTPAAHAAGGYEIRSVARPSDAWDQIGEAGDPVLAETASGSERQRWNVVPGPEGFSVVVNAASGDCLTGGEAGITAEPCTRDPHQWWRIRQVEGGVQFELHVTNGCVTHAGSGRPLAWVRCEPERIDQKWRIVG